MISGIGGARRGIWVDAASQRCHLLPIGESGSLQAATAAHSCTSQHCVRALNFIRD